MTKKYVVKLKKQESIDFYIEISGVKEYLIGSYFNSYNEEVEVEITEMPSQILASISFNRTLAQFIAKSYKIKKIG